MRSSKIDNVVKTLAQQYRPFNMLSPEALPEIADAARFIEMRQGEIFQIKGGKGRDLLFLIEGRVDVIVTGGMVSLLNSDQSRRPFMIPPAPDACTLVAASEEVIVCHIDHDKLDRLISWNELVNMAEEADQTMYWRMNMLRNSRAFRRLPLENVEAAFKRMRPVKVKKGEEVIRCGEEAKTFYVITKGSAEVWRRGVYDDELRKVAELGEGDTFGNDALITGYKRNETVRMCEDGQLLALAKKDFEQIVSRQLIRTVNANIAKTMLENGYRLLDVRYAEEHEEMSIPDAILIPLHELGERIGELDPKARYIAYCHSGNRSAVAAMRLSQHGFDVLSLEGGIRDWPFALIAPTP